MLLFLNLQPYKCHKAVSADIALKRIDELEAQVVTLTAGVRQPAPYTQAVPGSSRPHVGAAEWVAPPRSHVTAAHPGLRVDVHGPIAPAGPCHTLCSFRAADAQLFLTQFQHQSI